MMKDSFGEGQPGDFESSDDRESLVWLKSRKSVDVESMDFEETESIMWRKHQLRRFFQDRGRYWNTSRRSTAWKWFLVISLGFLIGLMGYFVTTLTEALTSIKFSVVNNLMQQGDSSSAFFAFLGFCLLYTLIAGILCWIEPLAAGSGIPEIKAYLNGIKLEKVVRIKVFFSKVIGMCFSCSSNLPLGKEGPMIHAGAILGAAVSQGRSFTLGFDTSWTKFQDLRNDRSKRDFVTFGAAAGVAAAFNAPIGGILFTLEEGASFWSTTITFRAFFCAMITQLTMTLLSSISIHENTKLSIQSTGSESSTVFAFGTFSNFTKYYPYELILFALIGAAGGVLGALFNHINHHVTIYRNTYIKTHKWKRLVEVLILTAGFAIICFVISLMWGQNPGGCTPIPKNTADWSPSQINLLNSLVQFGCGENQFNQVASLYLTDADTAMQQLFHFQEFSGSSTRSFETSALVLFFIPYFFYAAITSGTFCPAGLFVPTLLSGAAYGRIIGHLLNAAFPNQVSESGIYALVGAAAVLGGMSRMTIAGTIIILEAAGTPLFLLPLMVTFAAARYAGNAINIPMYDMHIELQELPFLEGNLRTLGLLNYHPITEVMSQHVDKIYEINRVKDIYALLKNTSHNGYPVVTKHGQLTGLMMRKHLCTLLKLRAFTKENPIAGGDSSSAHVNPPSSTVFHDTLERNYPHYPTIEEIRLNDEDMNSYLDVRAYLDTAPFSTNESSSIQRVYRLFRTMGLRHLIVLDEKHRVKGIVTRRDISEPRLEHHWFREGDNLQKFINVGPMNTNDDNPEDSFAPNENKRLVAPVTPPPSTSSSSTSSSPSSSLTSSPISFSPMIGSEVKNSTSLFGIDSPTARSYEPLQFESTSPPTQITTSHQTSRPSRPNKEPKSLKSFK